jgi:hypothetical protein
LTLRGFDAGYGPAEILGLSAEYLEWAAQIPAHPPPTDQLAAFVANLTPAD